MNIFKLGHEREVYMVNLYRELAEKTSSIGFKRIFEMMAHEEAKHADSFKEREARIPEEKLKDYFVEAKNTFENLKQKKEIFQEEEEQLWLYCKIRDLEEENMKFYEQAAINTTDEKLKKIYYEFAREEFRHYEMMEEIVQFVGRPLTWVSSPEISSLKEY